MHGLEDQSRCRVPPSVVATLYVKLFKDIADEVVEL